MPGSAGLWKPEDLASVAQPRRELWERSRGPLHATGAVARDPCSHALEMAEIWSPIGWHQKSLARDFSATGSNANWVMNITDMSPQENWLYLADVLGLFSRQMPGGSMPPQLGRDLVLQAVLLAV